MIGIARPAIERQTACDIEGMKIDEYGVLTGLERELKEIAASVSSIASAVSTALAASGLVAMRAVNAA